MTLSSHVILALNLVYLLRLPGFRMVNFPDPCKLGVIA